jgi:hypothetical protein
VARREIEPGTRGRRGGVGWLSRPRHRADELVLGLFETRLPTRRHLSVRAHTAPTNPTDREAPGPVVRGIRPSRTLAQQISGVYLQVGATQKAEGYSYLALAKRAAVGARSFRGHVSRARLARRPTGVAQAICLNRRFVQRPTIPAIGRSNRSSRTERNRKATARRTYTSTVSSRTGLEWREAAMITTDPPRITRAPSTQAVAVGTTQSVAAGPST